MLLPLSTPVQVSGISTASAVTAGWHYSCALLAGGVATCWGYNLFGRLGNGAKHDSAIPGR